MRRGYVVAPTTPHAQLQKLEAVASEFPRQRGENLCLERFKHDGRQLPLDISTFGGGPQIGQSRPVEGIHFTRQDLVGLRSQSQSSPVKGSEF